MTKYTLHKGVFRLPAGYRFPPDSAESTERFYQRAIGFIRRVLRVQGITVTIDGAENIPASGGALLAMNHTGYYDFIFGAAPGWLRGRRLVRFMAKKEIFDVPVVGTLMGWMKHVPVDRSQGAGAVVAAKEHLQAGSLVGIFPEATISRSFELKDFKSGAARIAHDADVPLIPMVCWGSQRVWTKGGKAKLGRSGIPVWITVGKAIPTDSSSASVTAQLKDAMQALLDETREKYAAEYGPFADGLDWMPAALGGTAPTLAQANGMDEADRKARAAKKAQRSRNKEG